jgi:hypothetical protein
MILLLNDHRENGAHQMTNSWSFDCFPSNFDKNEGKMRGKQGFLSPFFNPDRYLDDGVFEEQM